MKLIIQKTTFISLILIICIISYIGYKFPNLLPLCFQLSIIAATLLSINLLWIYPFQYQISIIRIFIASVILFIYIGTNGYFLQHYPLFSFSEPINCFIVVWGIVAYTFLTLTLFMLTFKNT